MDKRGVVSISTFSFIILILMSLFGLTYYFYDSFKEDLEVLNKETLVINSVNSFKGEIINIVLENNSYLNYSNILDSQEIIFYVENSNIKAQVYFKENLIEKTSSLYGIEFCDNYSFAPNSLTQFYFNGNCISIISS